MKVKVNDKGEYADISKNLYDRFIEEKNKFNDWLDSLDENYELFSEYQDTVTLVVNNQFEANKELESELFATIEDEQELETPYYYTNIIGYTEDNPFEASVFFSLIQENFPEIIDKINSKIKQLGNLWFETYVFDDYLYRFIIFVPSVYESDMTIEEIDKFIHDNYEEIAINKIDEFFKKEYDKLEKAHEKDEITMDDILEKL
jgi:hypothetical protein